MGNHAVGALTAGEGEQLVGVTVVPGIAGAQPALAPQLSEAGSHVPVVHSPVASPSSGGPSPLDAFVQNFIAYNPDLSGKDAVIKTFMKEYGPH